MVWGGIVWTLMGCSESPITPAADSDSTSSGIDITSSDTDTSSTSGDSLDTGDGTSDTGNPSDDTSTAILLEPPVLGLSFSQIKQFDFSWSAVPEADHYRLFERADPGAPFVQLGGDILSESTSITMPLHFRAPASYKLQACNDDGCSESAVVDVVDSLAQAVGYFKASNPDEKDEFGGSVALSDDGTTLAVGAAWEDSGAIGIDGDQSSNSVGISGAVYVFVRSGSSWSQQAYVKPSNTGAADQFGCSVALSSNGDTLAVGACMEDSSGMGVDGIQTDDSAPGAGAVYVFARNAGVWSQQAYVKASNTGLGDAFGQSVSLSDDGDTLAVGAYHEDSGSTGIDGLQADNSNPDSGAVYVFVRKAGVWSQHAYIKASNTDSLDHFGYSVALSGNGDTLAVGAYNEDSSETGIGGKQTDDGASAAGAVYVFVRSGGKLWSQQAYIKASNTDAFDWFGIDVALSGDGDTLAVGAYLESSTATGIDGIQTDNAADGAGAAYVFVREDGIWSQQAYVKASNTGEDDGFGSSLALSGDGNVLAIGAQGEDSKAVGVEGDQLAGYVEGAGAVYVFVREGGVWSQRAYVKSSNTATYNYFGEVALADDGETLAVGAYGERSVGVGVGGKQGQSGGAHRVGAVYLY